MSDINKDFESIFEVPDFLHFDGEDYMYYDEDPILQEQQQHVSALFSGYKSGLKDNKKIESFANKLLKNQCNITILPNLSTNKPYTRYVVFPEDIQRTFKKMEGEK